MRVEKLLAFHQNMLFLLLICNNLADGGNIFTRGAGNLSNGEILNNEILKNLFEELNIYQEEERHSREFVEKDEDFAARNIIEESKSRKIFEIGASKKRIINLSNAAPIKITQEKKDKWEVAQSSGGLVIAVEPIIEKNNRNIWIFSHVIEKSLDGKSIDVENSLKEFLKKNKLKKKYKLLPIFVDTDDYSDYYTGISNGLLWPGLHNMPNYITDDYVHESGRQLLRKHWGAYVRTNMEFAIEAWKNSTLGDFIWVHDYQLIMVGMMLRKMDPNLETGFFLHIPFQPPIFAKYPKVARKVFQGMMAYSKVGFQAERDRIKFVEMIKTYYPNVEVVNHPDLDTIVIKYMHGEQQWICSLGVFPISIKNEDFLSLANSRKVKKMAKKIREQIFGPNPEEDVRLFFSAERFDYTKGIRSKLHTFDQYLERHQDRIGKDVFFQLAVTNRSSVKSYREYQDDCKDIAEKINRKYIGKSKYGNWKPIIFESQQMERDKLVAHYLAMDIGVVTPRMDGMNLVSKEMILCNPSAGLILSTGAGTEGQLFNAGFYKTDSKYYHRIVEIHNFNENAEIYYQAALEPKEVRRANGEALKKFVVKNDNKKWSRNFLDEQWSPEALNDGNTQQEKGSTSAAAEKGSTSAAAEKGSTSAAAEKGSTSAAAEKGSTSAAAEKGSTSAAGGRD